MIVQPIMLLLALSFLPAAEVVRNESGVTGNIKKHPQFISKFVDPRNIDVWLPPSYEVEKNKRYAVVYMHDGQNLFDPRLAYIGVDWGIDETMTRLISEHKIREAIVVGIWNTPKRVNEYMPEKPVEEKGEAGLKAFNKVVPGAPVSDNYLKFLVLELKPFIDSTYRTNADRENTFIMGSSMGGLISAYAVSEYEQVFGGAGCISTHWPIVDGAVIDYLKKKLPDPRTHKFYFDYGTETIDAQYEPYQLRMDAVMKAAGYQEGRNWITKKFPGAEHSERAWRKRVDLPLVFLLGA